MTRVFNFMPGPATMPESVLEQIQVEMLDFHGLGVSILEMSHRSQTFVDLVEETIKNLRELMNIPDTYEVLFCHGGGHGQFAMVPMNLIGKTGKASYLINGHWSKLAFKEAQKYGQALVACEIDPIRVPYDSEVCIDPESSYVYYCANETIHGVEYFEVPDSKGLPLVADMSSDFMSKPIDVEKHALIWAALQKNFGPAGLSVAIVRKDLLGAALPITPTIFNYKILSDKGSMPNTPSVFPLYCANLMTKWLKEKGGLKAIEANNIKKATLVYEALEAHPTVFNLPVEPQSRSRMNVVFTLRNEADTQAFVDAAAKEGMVGLKGHRVLGGIRASIYNALPLEGAQKLADFIHAWARFHG